MVPMGKRGTVPNQIINIRHIMCVLKKKKKMLCWYFSMYSPTIYLLTYTTITQPYKINLYLC